MSADTDNALVECDSCGEDVLVMVELRGDDAVEADVLCAQCADDETSEAGEVTGR